MDNWSNVMLDIIPQARHICPAAPTTSLPSPLSYMPPPSPPSPPTPTLAAAAASLLPSPQAAEGGPSSCGTWAIVPYAATFLVLVSFILLSLFMAVLIEVYETQSRMAVWQITPKMLEDLVWAWRLFDDGSGTIAPSQCLHLLLRLPRPLGVADSDTLDLSLPLPHQRQATGPPQPPTSGREQLQGPATQAGAGEGEGKLVDVQARDGSGKAGTGSHAPAAGAGGSGSGEGWEGRGSSGGAEWGITGVQVQAVLELVRQLDVPLDPDGRLTLHAVAYELVRRTCETELPDCKLKATLQRRWQRAFRRVAQAGARSADLEGEVLREAALLQLPLS
ncbi:hypothetical protein V8C86DRAFT_1137271 [Haematococcus lacustris]